MAKGFLRGMLQLVFWPLFRPSRWQTKMAELDLSPGPAMMDLSLRRREHRRLAAQVWTLWLLAAVWNAVTGISPLSLVFGVVSAFAAPLLALLAIIAIGASMPGAIALLLLWHLLTPVIILSAYNIHGMGALPLRFIIIGATLLVFWFGGLRYRRNVGLGRQVVGLLAAPFLMFVAWIPILAVAVAVQAGLSVALFSAKAADAWSLLAYAYEMFVPTFLEVCMSFPIILLLLVLPLACDLLRRVLRRRDGGPVG